MFIQTENTPNPETLKFLPGRIVLASGAANFPSKETATLSPLAERLFAIEGVEALYFGYDFITVTKAAKADWSFLKPIALSAIMEHFVMGMPVMAGDAAGITSTDSAADANAIHENDDDIIKQIKELLNSRVRPAVAQDGGDIIFNRFEEGILYLQMQGACAGCPSSTATLKSGIENMMRHYIPEVEEVRAA